jgi:hypothetical protein
MAILTVLDSSQGPFISTISLQFHDKLQGRQGFRKLSKVYVLMSFSFSSKTLTKACPGHKVNVKNFRSIEEVEVTSTE